MSLYSGTHAYNMGREDYMYEYIPQYVSIAKSAVGGILSGTFDGFKLDYIFLYMNTNGLEPTVHNVEIDDKHYHHYSFDTVTPTNNFYGSTYSPHVYRPELTSTVSLSAATVSANNQISWLKSHLPTLSSNEVYHLRLTPETIHTADKSLMQSLMAGNGNLMLEHNLNGGSRVSVEYNSTMLKNALGTTTVSSEFNFANILTQNPANADSWVLDFSKHNALYGLSEINLHSSSNYDVFSMNALGLTYIGHQLETTPLGTMKLPTDGSVETFLIVRKDFTSPKTGE